MEGKKYFYGNEISEYGVKNNRVDYRALAKSFDAVLCNDITKLFYSTINGEYIEPEIINGHYYYYENENGDILSPFAWDDLNDDEKNTFDEMENEIFQYYIVNAAGYRILSDYTNEIIFYIEALDMYIWGVTHYGTGWDYVLTDIKIEEDVE